MPSQATTVPVPLSHRCRRGIIVVASTRGRSGCSEFSLPGGYNGATARDLLEAGFIRRHRTDSGNSFLLTPEGLRAAESHGFEVTTHARAAAEESPMDRLHAVNAEIGASRKQLEALEAEKRSIVAGMTQPFDPTPPPAPSDYTVGQAVYVHAFGSWYAGKVVKLGRTKVHATYTSGTGTSRTKACSMDQVSLTPGQSRGESIRDMRAGRRPRR